MPKIQSLFQKFFIPTLFLLASTPAKGQITPDNTLGAEASSITPNALINGANADLINGGAQRGNNLFHSFTEFNINDGQRVYFGNPSGVQNILTRVTGGNGSNILGTLGVNGNANLFLINPNGIVFGQNARLDIRGSFVGTTANGVQFGNQGNFSATNPQAVPLLTVNPSALLFNQINQNNPGQIQVQGNGQGLRLTSDLIDTLEALRVAPDKTLALVGGDMSLEGATLKTAGGRIELGSVSGEGLVSLTPIDKGFSLAYDGVKNFGNIQLSQLSVIDASGEGAGDVKVVGNRIHITDGSTIETSTLGQKSGGNLVVNAQESIDVFGNLFPSGLFAGVYSGATGTGADLTINTDTLRVENGSQINTITFSSGKGGNLTVTAKDIQVIGIFPNNSLYPSSLSNVTYGQGDSGNLTINTGSLLIQGGAQVINSTFGAGNSGKLIVNASENIQVTGISTNGESRSFLETTSQDAATGNAGSAIIQTKRLSVLDGAFVGSTTYSTGKAGDVLIIASDLIEVIRGLTNNVSTRVSVQTEGSGIAGNLNIETSKLIVGNGAQVSAGTFGSGDGGTLQVNASDFVELFGASANGKPSGLFTQSDFGEGDAGDLKVTTRRLIVRDGAVVSAATFVAGQGGNLIIQALDSVEIVGTSPQGRLSRLLTQTQGSGSAGNLSIETKRLIVRDGAQITADTYGAGKGGNLIVEASEEVRLIGRSVNGQFLSELSAAAAVPESTGSAGDVTINTPSLQVLDGARIAVRSLGQGNAGNLNVNANSIRLNNQATITADTRSANVNPNKEQATINLNSKDMILRRGSNISANATGENVIGGNININTDILAAVQNSDISANSTDSRGGRVKITAQGIFGTQPRNFPTLASDITATGANPDLSGTTEINTPDVDPTKGLTELPIEVIDASTKFSQLCPRDPNPKPLGKFIVTGRGSLPPSPLEFLTGTSINIPLATLDEQTATPIDGAIAPVSNPSPEIIEAQGWIKTANGIVLVANAPNATPSSRPTAAVCPHR